MTGQGIGTNPGKDPAMTATTHHAPAPATPTTVVWVEIAVTDLSRASAFYGGVFGYAMIPQKDEGQDTLYFDNGMSGASGHRYEGTPATGGMVINLAVPDRLEEAMARCTAHGGQVTSPAIQIPPGRFAYAKDPDGNGIGLFEPRRA